MTSPPGHDWPHRFARPPRLRAWLESYHGVVGAQGEIRTRTPYGAAPSRRCVYQFHHLGERQERSVFVAKPAADCNLTSSAAEASSAPWTAPWHCRGPKKEAWAGEAASPWP